MPHGTGSQSRTETCEFRVRRANRYPKPDYMVMLPRLELGICGLKGRRVNQFHYSTIAPFLPRAGALFRETGLGLKSRRTPENFDLWGRS